MKFIDLNKQYQRIGDNIKQGIHAVLEHGQFINGPEVKALEQKLAEFSGAKHCIAVGNGTDALLLTMMALDLKPGDEIITPAFSYIAVVEMAALLGVVPVLVDVDKSTYNMDPASLEAAITEKTKAIYPVSLYGQCADYDAINAIATKHNLPVIEDAGQSFGARYKGRGSCSLTTMATTSFYPSKPLGCYGDGGACFTNSDELAVLLRQLRDHGQDRGYHHLRVGLNSRLDSMQAAVLLAKLDVFAQELDLRRKATALYSERLQAFVQPPVIEEHNETAMAQFTIQVPDRPAVQAKLKELGVPTAVHYPAVICDQPGYQKNCRIAGSIENSKYLAEHVVSLPMYADIDEATIKEVVAALQSVLSEEG